MNYLKPTMLLLIAAGLFQFPNPSIADDSKLSKSKDISEFTLPDGRFDFEKIRQSRYQGAVDLEALVVNVDPNTGEPLVTSSSPSLTSSSADNIYWDNSISPSIQSRNTYRPLCGCRLYVLLRHHFSLRAPHYPPFLIGRASIVLVPSMRAR